MALNAKTGARMSRALKTVGELYVNRLRKKLKEDDTYATGSLADSVDYKIIDGSVDILMATYGKAVEKGSSPASQGYQKVSTRFLSDIMEWMEMKPNISWSTPVEKKSIANAIARGIKKEGIIKRFGYGNGSDMMDKTYNEIEKQIGETLATAYMQDLKEKLENSIK